MCLLQFKERFLSPSGELRSLSHHMFEDGTVAIYANCDWILPPLTPETVLGYVQEFHARLASRLYQENWSICHCRPPLRRPLFTPQTLVRWRLMAQHCDIFADAKYRPLKCTNRYCFEKESGGTSLYFTIKHYKASGVYDVSYQIRIAPARKTYQLEEFVEIYPRVPATTREGHREIQKWQREALMPLLDEPFPRGYLVWKMVTLVNKRAGLYRGLQDAPYRIGEPYAKYDGAMACAGPFGGAQDYHGPKYNFLMAISVKPQTVVFRGRSGVFDIPCGTPIATYRLRDFNRDTGELVALPFQRLPGVPDPLDLILKVGTEAS